jgi:hypothetical protein
MTLLLQCEKICIPCLNFNKLLLICKLLGKIVTFRAVKIGEISVYDRKKVGTFSSVPTYHCIYDAIVQQILLVALLALGDID